MATEKISEFFRHQGFALRNDRTSWGAANGEAVMLRCWNDEAKAAPYRVRVFLDDERPGGTTLFGRNERIAHVRAAWLGGIALYAVIVTPKIDKKNGSRTIGEFRSDVIFPVNHLVEEGDSIYAVLDKPVAVEMLPEHIQSYKLKPNANPLPTALQADEASESDDAASRAAKLAAGVREFLIDAAERRSVVTYGELFDGFDLNRYTVAPVLGDVGHQCLREGEPVLTALVVQKGGETPGRCGPGFKATFMLDEDEERARVFEWWASSGLESEQPKNRDWTDEELRASVEGYAEMMRLEEEGAHYVKAHFYRQLATRFGRVEGAFERRMQNISFLLESRGFDWLQGLKPQQNIGVNVKPRLIAFMNSLFEELSPSLEIAEEVIDAANVVEGAKRQIVVNAYERDPTAKPRCIKKWGSTCVVCEFDFHAAYGELGKGFIHVHHLRPIHTIGESYELDPEKDLRPVCPNCHSMLHRKKKVLSIEELTRRLRWKFKPGPDHSIDPEG